MSGSDKTLTGLEGEYYVLAQLAHRGLVGAMTLSTTEAVDILVSNPELDGLCKLEVKTTSKKPRKAKLFGEQPFFIWPMSKKHESIADADLFYCFVALTGPDARPRFFIVPSAEVARYVRWQHTYWLDTRKKPVKDTPLRNYRIAANDPNGYEDDWELLFR